MNGWIRLHREALESRVFPDPHLWQLWTWCLMQANWKPAKWLDETLEPGQFVFSNAKAAKLFKVSQSTIHRRLDKLERWGMVHRRPASKYTVLTIVNWAEYQAEDAERKNGPNFQNRPKNGTQKRLNAERKNGQQTTENAAQYDAGQFDAERKNGSTRNAGGTQAERRRNQLKKERKKESNNDDNDDSPSRAQPPDRNPLPGSSGRSSMILDSSEKSRSGKAQAELQQSSSNATAMLKQCSGNPNQQPNSGSSILDWSSLDKAKARREAEALIKATETKGPQKIDAKTAFEIASYSQLSGSGLAADLICTLRAGTVNKPRNYARKALEANAAENGIDLAEIVKTLERVRAKA